MLNDGIRFFDLRFAFNPTNSTLVFWHSEALQSETATVPDVLFAFYKWLDDHPTETLLLSFMYESSTTAWAHNNAAVQAQLFAALTSDAAKRYIDQTHNALPTLGAARGKIILLRRFVLDQLNSTYEAALPGLSFPPSAWLDDNRDFSITYNPSHNLSAYIEDYYEPDDVPAGLGAATNIAAKLNATAAHLQKAASGVAPDGLFITFSSAERDADEPAVYPKIMALGNGTDVPGVNQQLVPVIQGLKGKRLGVVVLDFFEMPGTLVPAILGI
ncbi:hypothetical protein K432DRAFT_387357 [Lepidopterella palustris CBS 459.81]|uniref:PLC-like phosphodiesterase n=1 Tax=Lepidopterella palustris CBS 459.81 TaxID=1314670 RepID=A0A8E2DXS2_9PEZI|nr:hypothetical protein K432DRAFT_387357 [Lepidopterella palustris CBS 459.81]